SKSYHYGEAAKAKENVDYYTKQAEKAAKNGDFNKSNDYTHKAESYSTKVKEENSAAQRSSKLVDNTSLPNESKDVSASKTESTPELEQNTRTELTKEERIKLQERTGWSDAIVNAIRTKEEAEIYENAGLVEGEVNGKPALLQPDLKPNARFYKNWPEWTNKDFAGDGYPPRSADGKPIELHHIGQNPNSPLAELTYEQHHKNGNFKKLHTFDDSKIDRGDFKSERVQYWLDRYNTM
ncbi:MAG: HNH/ENDO VII family nuclease, partial [Allobaculum sp.]|nr:HNH/ENDO VII family nuclease [Allobaculum sp.]